MIRTRITATGARGFAGYQVNRNVAIELVCDWLGKYQVDQRFGNGVDAGLEWGSQGPDEIQATMKSASRRPRRWTSMVGRGRLRLDVESTRCLGQRRHHQSHRVGWGTTVSPWGPGGGIRHRQGLGRLPEYQ